MPNNWVLGVLVLLVVVQVLGQYIMFGSTCSPCMTAFINRRALQTKNDASEYC